MANNVNAHPSFEWLRSQSIDALDVQMHEFRHIKTGALHYHIASQSQENVFLVALRTMPQDSNGVAHILEHTALCGSKKYPVRDPFFMMIRRSLNTFMNAFTSSDWTAYPFASQNDKDFNNLLDVYLDAVFFSRLDELDFMQEGHRVEFSEKENKDSELEYKGVVFNEMKGAMSSPTSVLWQSLSKHLFPSNTYHHNSGGEPADIPDLSYQDLKEFYKTHYHPSNAIFMTFCNIDASIHQEKFEKQALNKFSELDIELNVPDVKRYLAPVNIEESYVFQGDDLSQNTHIVMGWVLGHSTNLDEMLEAQFLSSILFENSASPLRSVLETTELGRSPSPLCGLEDSNKEMSFMCGIEGSEANKAEEFEALVLETLQGVVDNGVDSNMVNSVLHQLELSQREIGGDGYPYGLQLILASLGSAIHRGDAIALLDLEPALARLKEKAQNTDFTSTLVARLLLNNQHRIRLTMKPDANLGERKIAAEKAQLSAIKDTMSEADKDRVVEQSLALAKRQEEDDDASLLPKVTLDDVPDSMITPTGEPLIVDGHKGQSFEAGTNGLIYQQILMPLPALTTSELEVLPYFSQCLTELGCGDRDYLENQRLQSEVCGGISCYSSLRGTVQSEQEMTAYMVLSGKALVRNADAFFVLMRETLMGARFDEHARINELLSQYKARKENSISGNGHGYAMQAASGGMSPIAQLTQNMSGLNAIETLRTWCKKIEDPSGAEELSLLFKSIRDKIVATNWQPLLIADPEHVHSLCRSLDKAWSNKSASIQDSTFSLPTVRESKRVFWSTNAQVNFCAKSYPTVSAGHPDAAPLTVLGGFLRNGFLHRAIREQGGAYGAGATQDSSSASFRFYSYRDPRIEGTLDDFDASVRWMIETTLTDEALEEAILGVISSLDKPASPAGEAKQAHHNEVHGRTEEQRLAFRQAILKITTDDLVRVTKDYLSPEKASIAVVSNETQAHLSEGLGLELHTL
jgi:Zn-dependent M16 (insulinase) family peptidase